MSDYDVGYGRPPKHSQFKKGVCPNPRGRGKRGNLQIGEIMKRGTPRQNSGTVAR
jgi:hypothetical protein